MKPVLMRHVEARNESFKAWTNGHPYIRIPWHYHPECEITYIHKGKGKLFVGDKMVEYGDGDIVLIGPNLPHEWRNDIPNPDFDSETVSAHFTKDFLGDTFYQLPEAGFLSALLDKSSRGLSVEDEVSKKEINEIIYSLPETQGIERIYKLLRILQKISEAPKLSFLSSNSFAGSIDFGRDNRMNKIYEFVMKNFQDDISVSDVAQVINMTNTSFCRFFKERANKSFIKYLNEIRVGYSCKLLLEGELTISQTAFESGFGNLSNFNKQFKNIKKITPTEYMEEFFEKNSE
jgi:AraC-like DNA-binding protein